MTRAMLEDGLNHLGLRVYLIIGLFTLLLHLGGLAFIYWADQFATPSWNQRSVPPAALIR